MEGDYEIEDVENYSGGKDQNFSHQMLVMKCMKNAIEFGSCEMIPGTLQEVIDPKTGKIIYIHKEDTRERFIESVKTCMMIMICDYDGETRKDIGILKAKLKRRRDFWLGIEMEFFSSLSETSQREYYNKGILFVPKTFCRKLIYGERCIQDQLEIYRSIFEKLSILTKALDFYGETSGRAS